ncbi:G-type lectin S-receptor-like serine/threonine-protein kinase At4g27290 isoform X1 [Daucus carota subsp. sativus]|uniref:G-type lectin S-receptor-like serine/threonine-protein kinase At4g27290 isoform X1 n=1 Tax=Daucus carota subsp. sativus TaxID=79200 RepID=UPI0007EF4678|nr:PREDICTED: G-type lectin S-receptor-like serine/threonine-protein kinase At4g27290 isoform X1 [Daucus carota subsp. sativus]
MTGTVYKDSIIRCQSNTMDVTVMVLLFFALLSPLINSSAVDTIRENQTIRDGETITSSGGEFELGFFSPGRSRYRYLGIWYKKISSGTVVWVANRNAPIMNNLSMVRVDDKGITLQTVNGIIWSSNTSVSMKNPVAQILDSGNLVLRDDDHGIDNFIWQSFDYPGDIMLPGMKFGLDLVTGLDRYFTSWKSIDDPSTGNFTNRIDPNGFPQSFVLKGSVKWHRFGPWNGRQFSGTPNGNLNGIYTEAFVINEKEIYYKFDLIEASSAVIRFILTSSGWTELLVWNYENQSWKQFAAVRVSGCDRYRLCGAYGVCNINGSPRCECLREFVPKFPEKWTSNWSGGCVREKKIDCRSDATFMKYSGVKLPDTRHSWYDMKTNLAECRRLCLQNCSCTAYANADIRRGGSGCILWFDHLIDMMGYTEDGQDIYVKMPASELVEGQRSKAKRPNFIFLIPLVLVLVALALTFLYISRKRRQKEKGNLELGSELVALNKIESEDWELPLVDFKNIEIATDNFSQHNKLGEGGFGPVYKGILKNGQEIAVKRLSKNSRQGADEFINEVSVIGKLQHRNLVALVGCCAEKDERILIYEYMANKSLDSFIFDEETRRSMDWMKRFKIVTNES